MLFLALMLTASLTACNRDRVENVERNPAGGVDVTATVSEADLQQFANAVFAEVNTLLEDQQVDLRDDAIVITGQEPGSDMTGSITMTVTVQDGALLVQATDVQITDVSISDERIAQVNDRMTDRFRNRADPENRAINYQSMTITESGVTVVINLRRTQNP
ncbi:MAG: LmeA family phospholipid-binding protein [Chloroflexota bacterium]